MVSPVVLAFPGNADMSGVNVRDLIAHLPGIRLRLDEVFEIARDSAKVDLLPLLSPAEGDRDGVALRLSDAVARNLAIFALSWSFGQLLVDAGLEPTALVGYSLGEIAAATVGGIWSLEGAVTFVAERAALMAKSGPGAMLAVHASGAEMRSRLVGRAIDVAVEVTRNLTVIAGSVDSIAEEARRLSASGYGHFVLRVDCAAHSSMLDPYVADVERLASRQTLHTATLPLVNGETGLFDDGSMQTVGYWGRHLRGTRRFASTLDTLGRFRNPLIIEMGPATLSGILARSSDDTPEILQAVGAPGGSHVAATLDLFAAIQESGHQLSFGILAGRGTRHRVSPGTRDLGAVRSVQPLGSVGGDGTGFSTPSAMPSANRETTSEGSPYATPDVAGVLAVLQSTLPTELHDDQHFFEAGGNSLLAMEALTRIEDRFGIRIKIREFLRDPTARHLATLLRDPSKGAGPVADRGEFVSGNENMVTMVPTKVHVIGPVTPRFIPSVTTPITGEHGRTGDLPLLSLQFFSGDVEAESIDRYRLLLDAARSADRAGLHALWFPERHFNRFGGLYPSASVLAAAVATITENIGLRGGSVVAPLNHPVRIAEEWAMVANLSGGRAGVAFGSGFVPRDFVLAPGSFDARKQVMFEAIAAVRSMWQGNPYSGVGGSGLPTSVDVFPRPVRPDLPLWLSTTRDIATFVEAGELGFGVLTALLRLTTEELAERIAAYRQARQGAGHAGPGSVTLMVHTYVGEDAADVHNMTYAPLRTYIRAHMEHTRELLDTRTLSSADEEELLDHAQERYLTSAGLFGTEAECRSRLSELRSLGVDEVACLMDFGMSSDAVLKSIDRLGRLSVSATARSRSGSAARQK